MGKNSYLLGGGLGFWGGGAGTDIFRDTWGQLVWGRVLRVYVSSHLPWDGHIACVSVARLNNLVIYNSKGGYADNCGLQPRTTMQSW